MTVEALASTRALNALSKAHEVALTLPSADLVIGVGGALAVTETFPYEIGKSPVVQYQYDPFAGVQNGDFLPKDAK